MLEPKNRLRELYSSMCGKDFSIYGVSFPENHWINAFLLMPQSLPLKNPGKMFWKCFLQDRRVEEAMICSVKIQPENMKMTWNISLFPFGMIAIFLNAI